MPVFSPADHAHFAEHGYVVLHDAAPKSQLKAVVDAIWDFLGMDPHDPEDWYREPHRKGGMVELYHHPALWANRQHPHIHQAFSEIWNTEKLWVSFDRVSMKPPTHPGHLDYDDPGFIHWDCDTSKLPLPFAVQGVLYLTDTAEDQGGFQCVPGIHRRLEEWIKTQPPDRNTHRPDITGLEVKKIVGKAGDLVIWDSLLAHGNGRNTSNVPRFAQYISMFPPGTWEHSREQRLEEFEARRPWNHEAFPGDPRGWEQAHAMPVNLTSLGRKLLGADTWE